MAKRTTLVLFGYALYLVTCGLSPLFIQGMDSVSHFHGIRLAAVICLCGLFASRLKRSPVLSVLTIDSAALLIVGASINYARLANKWYSTKGLDSFTPYQFGVMAIGGFFAIWLLMRTRPKHSAKCGEWWRPTPLITIPTLIILPITRRRHGLGFSRRVGLALGAILLATGLVFSMNSYLPQVSIAQLIRLGKFAQENDELLRIAMAEPDLVARFLEDPSNAGDILADPRAKELIEELSAEGGLLEGVDTKAMVDSIASGNFENLNEILKDGNFSGTEELLALVAEDGSPLSELLGEDGAAAAKELSAKLTEGNSTLEEVLSEDGGQAAHKLMSSLTGSKSDDSNSSANMEELKRKLLSSIDPKMLNKLQGAGSIDINDPNVQAALKKMNIKPQDAAKLFSQASSKGSAANLLSQSGSVSLNTEPTTTLVPADSMGSQISSGRISNKVLAERDESGLSNKQPHLSFTPIVGRPKPKPFELINVQDIVMPQQDIITKRLIESEKSSAIEILASEDDIDEPKESGIQESLDAIETLVAIPDANDREVANTNVIDKSLEAVVQADSPEQTTSASIDKITQQLTIPLDDPKSLTGLFCIIVGLVAVSASLARR